MRNQMSSRAFDTSDSKGLARAEAYKTRLNNQYDKVEVVSTGLGWVRITGYNLPKDKVTRKDVPLMAGILAVSNLGIAFRGQWKDNQAVSTVSWLLRHPYPHWVTGEYAVQIASHLIESDEMEECFRNEGRHWEALLNRKSLATIKKEFPDVWAMVEGGHNQ